MPILAFAVAGFCIASYLAAFQLGAVRNVWEPFFGDGSRKVLHSFISQMLPVPDATLGAAGYLTELIAGSIGGGKRWRTMPWLVMVYGVFVAAVAGSALVLAFLQAAVIHAGCTLCLCSAALSLLIAWLSRREIFAAAQTIYEKRKTK